MRLACPNCDARYEVPDGAIPTGGRDVQCSNCGHAWFQLPEPAEPLSLTPAEPHAEIAAPRVKPVVSVVPAAPPSALPGGDSDPDDDPVPVDDHSAPDARPALSPDPLPEPLPDPAPVPAAEGPRSALDESVLSVLREEAELEAEARRVEAQRAASRRSEAESQMQVQPDLGMGDPLPEQTAAHKRLAMLKGQEPDPVEEPARLPARRDLLPDVEEINSTLRPDSVARDLEAEIDALPDLTRGGAFRAGFLLVVTLLILAAGLYIAADRVAELVPGLAKSLESYVLLVDGLRIWLNGLMDIATQKLGGMG